MRHSAAARSAARWRGRSPHCYGERGLNIMDDAKSLSTSVTIIGLGPRGLSLLERIVHSAQRRPQTGELLIELVDPGECGQGTHYARQFRHLLTNTLATQVTLFPLDSALGENCGLSFGDWANSARYRRAGG